MATKELQNEYGSASVDTAGARVVSWVPRGQEEVLFMPADGRGEAPRPQAWSHGGIPVCFPWFGTNGPAGSPMHGLVRSRDWTVAEKSQGRLVLTLDSDPAMKAWFAGDFRLTLEITLAETLDLGLTVENTGAEPFTCTNGFHPYFRVADCTRATVGGLDGCRYWYLTGFAPEPQKGPVTFGVERDNVYWTDGECPALADPILGRRIRVTPRGNKRFVVWNPGPAGDEGLGPDDWTRFVCVEPATLPAADGLTILPGGRRTLDMSLSCSRS